MRIRSILLVAAVAALPSLAFAATPVLRSGELSVGAEILPSDVLQQRFLAATEDRGATPSTGFNIRYAFDNKLALIGSVGLSLATIADDQDDAPVKYAVGVGGQYNLLQKNATAIFVRGGLQFVPRSDDKGDQELGVRFWTGPGIEARVAEQLSLQFYTAMLDLQLGGDTRFDLEIVPSIGMFLYY
jgi:hypothetical protein